MYTSTKEFTIEPHCPWYKEQQAYGPPNVNWCEPTRCAIINEPANTWSNLGLLLAGAVIVMKLNEAKEKTLRDFGFAVIVTGLFSFTYHATNNFFSQFFDFLGMYLSVCIPLAMQTQRLRGENPRHYHAFFWFYMFLSTCMFWFFTLWDIPIQHTIILQTVGIIVLELICKAKAGAKLPMKWFWTSLVLMGTAQTFSQLDIKRIWCEPENLILHGHAIWHVFSGLGLMTLGLHLRDVLRTTKS